MTDLLRLTPSRSLEDPATLRGASEKEIRDLVPGFKSAPAKGPGERLVDPERLGDQIRIMRGNPRDPNPIKQGPYVRVSRLGKTSDPIPLQGNPVLKKSLLQTIGEFFGFRGSVYVDK